MAEGKDLGVNLDTKQRIPFSSKGVRAVNRLLEIGDLGQLDTGDYPQTLDLTRWWKEAGPIVLESPKNKELFAGWDLKGNSLTITELKEGTPFEEIEQGMSSAGVLVAGQVVVDGAHLLDFHTHPEMSGEAEKMEEKSRKNKSKAVRESLKGIPESGFHDLIGFLTSCESYAMVICDTSVYKKGRHFPTLVVLKTAETPVITEENYWQHKRKFRNLTFGVLIEGYEKSKYRDILRRDLTWQKEFALAVYRGYLSANTNEPQIIRRSDIRLRKTPGQYMGQKSLVEKLQKIINKN